MIHHHLTEEEIEHLNDLHKVFACNTCRYFEENEYCEKLGHKTYPERFICDEYIEGKGTTSRRIRGEKQHG